MPFATFSDFFPLPPTLPLLHYSQTSQQKTPKTLLSLFSASMADKPQMAAITLGGKASSLSSTSVFLISNKLSQVRIDSSIFERLSSSSNSNVVSPSIKYQIEYPKFLTFEEIRASATILLSKLLLSASPIRIEIPNLICKTLNSESTSLVFESIDVTEEEKCVLDACLSVSVLDGICALLDYGASCLSPVSEMVAALSCEASKANVSAFNLVDSGDGKCVKDEASVASDLKVLLNGSKLTGKVEVDAVSSIPKVYGSLRASARAVHSIARAELNSVTKGNVGGTGEAWESVLMSLESVLRNLGESSLSRADLSVSSIVSDGLQSSLKSLIDEKCPTKQNLRDAYMIASKAACEKDYVKLVHNVNELFGLVMTAVSWEMITAIASLEGSDLLDKNEVAANGENAKVDKKKDKKKKVFGKGTLVVLELVRERLQNVIEDGADVHANLQKLADNLCSLLDPKVPAFGNFIEKIKEIVESNESRRLPKIPKGTRDFAKEQMTVREKAFSIITDVFKRHGAMALDTPVFELRETLMGKYGEDSKLIYDLADQGGELCSLRYDLTVPFARHVAMNSLTSFKRYQIAKVYRRDNPSKGRYREFYQCDFDIAGQFEKMGPDFEVVKILTELLDELNIGEYEVKLNHRKLLDGMLDICGVPPEKFRTICSSIDKMDKQSFELVKKEMVEEKGLLEETADMIGNFVKEKGSPLELLLKLKQEGSDFLKHEGAALALDELELLFKLLEKSKCVDKIVFDLSLARGLDYYTGVIFEAVFKGTTQVGSIAAGGRYDNLIGMFGSKQVPSVGGSLGIERVFAIMEQNQKDQNQIVRANETQVLVGVVSRPGKSVEDDLILAVELVNELWLAKIKAEYVTVKKVFKIFERAESSGIPFAVMVGVRDLKEGIVKLRDVKAKTEEEIPGDKMVEVLLKRLETSS
ncbi:histidine--tRNA ligase, cytoplasmic-like [Chenopodium quinoa]|uniref:Histidine--tRNA ligase, cytoplasmic n=1 Tax=Chenopodium quinoa TaxID=63459 RepID=A0A803N0Q0_CHEQI|nr:histidine--tRNA ligase, cytoplasmic-like [Chenopodium quinoa]